MTKMSKPAAEICFYGTLEHGFGWLATDKNGKNFGDGELIYKTLTAAFWAAKAVLSTDAMSGGPVSYGSTIRLFSPNGKMQADVKTSWNGHYGQIHG